MNDHECIFKEDIAVIHERLDRMDENLGELKEDIKNIREIIHKLSITIAEERAKSQAKGDIFARLIALASLLASTGNAILMILKGL